jgi:hypothetical protein
MYSYQTFAVNPTFCDCTVNSVCICVFSGQTPRGGEQCIQGQGIYLQRDSRLVAPGRGQRSRTTRPHILPANMGHARVAMATGAQPTQIEHTTPTTT